MFFTGESSQVDDNLPTESHRGKYKPACEKGERKKVCKMQTRNEFDQRPAE